MINLRTVTGILATAVLIVAGGCASSVSTIRYANVPDYPPMSPANVQILRSEPARPHQQLGEITVAGPGNTESAAREVEEKLRTAAAGIGANAVVVVVDPLQPGNVASRKWWGAPAGAGTGRDVIGVAIRYR
ncbi:MAG TPA: hypothetical protein VML91_14955 [Burkholderiales bacterium]|nr:hypothetical protein [Burkholderiales bacterium]